MKRGLQKGLRLLVVFLILQSTGVNFASAQTNFYKLHSLFIYNFIKNIQWQSVGDKFVIGVYGSDNAMKVLKENLAGKRMGSKDIEIIKVNTPSDADRCQVVYTPKSNKTKILNLIESSNHNGKIFVTEDDLTTNGASISFIIQNSKLRFKINKGNIDASGLKISSSLLSLGIVVNG